MDGYLALTICVVVVAAGFTISAVFETLHPKPYKPLNKFDAIDEELSRLHSDLGSYPRVPDWYAKEITRLNESLINAKNEES